MICYLSIGLQTKYCAALFIDLVGKIIVWSSDFVRLPSLTQEGSIIFIIGFLKDRERVSIKNLEKKTLYKCYNWIAFQWVQWP